MKRDVPVLRVIAITFLLFISTFQSFSQSISTANGKLEIGLGIGPLIFLGDLGGSKGVGRTFLKDTDIPLTKMSKGIFVTVYPVEWMGVRAAYNTGTLEGNDAQAPNKGGDEVTRLERNLSFRSKITEANLVMEFYPTVFLEQYDGLLGKIRPYGVFGAGIYHFNPQAQDNTGTWVSLQPLHTEGQGFPEYPTRPNYALTQLEVPMGFGVKFFIADNFFVGAEILHRKLFTDYVDDVSTDYIDPAYFDQYLTPANAALARQLSYRGTYAWANGNPSAVIGQKRGDPKQNDAFFSTIVKIGWRLNGSNAPNSRAANQMRCPKFY
jgi:hypothetical protein